MLLSLDHRKHCWETWMHCWMWLWPPKGSWLSHKGALSRKGTQHSWRVRRRATRGSDVQTEMGQNAGTERCQWYVETSGFILDFCGIKVRWERSLCGPLTLAVLQHMGEGAKGVHSLWGEWVNRLTTQQGRSSCVDLGAPEQKGSNQIYRIGSSLCGLVEDGVIQSEAESPRM